MALYCWRRNSFEGCCHALPWSSWSPLLSSWCCPCCASPLPFSLVIRSPYLNIIRVSNAGKDVNKIINPKSWLLPPLLAREQWRSLLSTRGASTRVTKPVKWMSSLIATLVRKGLSGHSELLSWGRRCSDPSSLQKCLVGACRAELTSRRGWGRPVLEPAAGEPVTYLHWPAQPRATEPSYTRASPAFN